MPDQLRLGLMLVDPTGRSGERKIAATPQQSATAGLREEVELATEPVVGSDSRTIGESTHEEADRVRRSRRFRPRHAGR